MGVIVRSVGEAILFSMHDGDWLFVNDTGARVGAAIELRTVCVAFK